MLRLTHLAGALRRLSYSTLGALLILAVMTSPAHAFFSGSRIGKLKHPHSPVPELSPGALGGGLLVLGMGVLLLTDRRRTVRSAAQN